MASTTVRIDRETLLVLRELAQHTGEAMPKVLAKAVEVYRRQELLERTNIAYHALRSDPDAWQEVQEDRETWDITVSDGLDEP